MYFSRLALGTKSTGYILSNTNTVEAAVKAQLKSADMSSTLGNTANHQSVSLAKDINRLKVWKAQAARDRGQFWTGIVQSFYIDYSLHLSPVLEM